MKPVIKRNGKTYWIEYERSSLTPDDPPGALVVHNFPPEPGQEFGDNGYRYWITDDPQGHRCHCDGIDEVHYGMVGWIDAPGSDDAGERSAA